MSNSSPIVQLERPIGALTSQLVNRMRATDRMCRLLHPPDRPPRSVVLELRDWIAEEMKADVAAVDGMYPGLQLAKLAGYV